MFGESTREQNPRIALGAGNVDTGGELGKADEAPDDHRPVPSK
jgi:hypothetical protein